MSPLLTIERFYDGRIGRYSYSKHEELVEILAELYRRECAIRLIQAHKAMFNSRVNGASRSPNPGALETFKKTMSEWVVDHGGIARPESVPDMLTNSNRLSEVHPPVERIPPWLARQIFAYAALAVIDLPTDAAHYAFWARNSQALVAKVVYEIYHETIKSDSHSNVMFPVVICEDLRPFSKRAPWWQSSYAPQTIAEMETRVAEWLLEFEKRGGVPIYSRGGGN